MVEIKLGKRLKMLREQKGLTQDELGKLLELKQQSIDSYEQGRSYPNVKNVIRIAELFGVTTDYLLGCEDNSKIENIEKHFTCDELELIKQYRKTGEKDKNIIRQVTGSISEKYEN